MASSSSIEEEYKRGGYLMEKMEQDEDLYKDETAFRELEANYMRE